MVNQKTQPILLQNFDLSEHVQHLKQGFICTALTDSIFCKFCLTSPDISKNDSRKVTFNKNKSILQKQAK